jgi:phosphoglycolate phosphatase-like HAD superfamily hydrolase
MLGAAILDFDGTLVESVGIKDRAFRTLFADRPDRIDAIMAYHLAHNATVRFDKFRHIVETILGEPYTQARAQQLTDRFSALVRAAIIDCPAVAGLDEFLDTLQPRLPLYLVSVSPEEELIAILRARGLAKRMTGIYSASWKKVDAIRDILQRECIGPESAVFVGDAPEDRRAAEAEGVRFIGRDSGKPLGAGVKIYRDLRGVLADIQADIHEQNRCSRGSRA